MEQVEKSGEEEAKELNKRAKTHNVEADPDSTKNPLHFEALFLQLHAATEGGEEHESIAGECRRCLRTVVRFPETPQVSHQG